jgi:hypothetical protein
MDDGAAPVANTVYYVFLIRKDSDGSIDALFSLSATAPTMPAGYTYKRKIRSVVTDAAANIRPTEQIGDHVYFLTPVLERALGAIANTNRTAYALSTPPLMLSILNIRALYNAAAADNFIWVASADYINNAPSATYQTLHISNTTVGQLVHNVKTDATRNIYARGTSTNIYLGIIAIGWIDDRGRDA